MLSKSWSADAAETATPEHVLLIQQCLDRLADQFKPIAAAAFASVVDLELRQPTTREQVDVAIAAALRSFSEPDQWLNQLVVKPAFLVYACVMRLWVGRKGKVLRVGMQFRQRILDGIAEAASHQLVRDWVNIVMEVSRDKRTIRREDLNGYLLPRDLFRPKGVRNPDDETAFHRRDGLSVEDVFSDVTGLDPEGLLALEVMARMCASLPEGRWLPEDAERLFRAEGYDIVD